MDADRLPWWRRGAAGGGRGRIGLPEGTDGHASADAHFGEESAPSAAAPPRPSTPLPRRLPRAVFAQLGEEATASLHLAYGVLAMPQMFVLAGWATPAEATNFVGTLPSGTARYRVVPYVQVHAI